MDVGGPAIRMCGPPLLWADASMPATAPWKPVSSAKAAILDMLESMFLASNMENIEDIPPADQVAAVVDAEAARDRLVRDLALPPFFYVSIGAAIAVQIALAAAGIAGQDSRSGALFFVGLAVFVAAGAIQRARFRRMNGVWVSGLLGRVMAGTATVSSAAYTLTLGVAVWAAFGSQWLLVALASVARGTAYAAIGRHWWRGYRRDPAKHARAESAAWVAALAALAVAGTVFLVIGR
jgi:hypothetical protein